MAKQNRIQARQKRHRRVRKHISGSPARPRLNVYRSLSQIYVQVVDDEVGHTLVSASSLEKSLAKQISGKNKSEQAGIVGELIAKRALDKGIEEVVFDRGGFRYMGRVKALAESARKAGLKF